MARPSDVQTPQCLISVVGGGAVGSHAVPLVGHLPQVTAVRLIDNDVYSQENLRGQAIGPADVGRAKVTVLASRLRRQAPHLLVDPVRAWVEDVPLGLLRGAVVLSCVDSRRARASLNEICWRLAVPLIDAGVDGPGLLARTNVYRPGKNRPCLECAWDATDYAAQEQVYACQGRPHASATRSSAALSAITAGLLAQTCQELLEGRYTEDQPNGQVLWDVKHSRCLATRYTRNPRCRFDHITWEIESAVTDLHSTSLGQILARHAPSNLSRGLQVPGHQFVCQLVCGHCGAVRKDCLLLDRALTAARRRCRSCGSAMSPSGFHCESELRAESVVAGRHARRSLRSLGLRPYDIVTLRCGERYWYLELLPADAATPEVVSRESGD